MAKAVNDDVNILALFAEGALDMRGTDLSLAPMGCGYQSALPEGVFKPPFLGPAGWAQDFANVNDLAR